jgi:hypothetical protein
MLGGGDFWYSAISVHAAVHIDSAMERKLLIILATSEDWDNPRPGTNLPPLLTIAG